MKLSTYSTILALLSALLLFSGCGDDDNNNAAATPTAPAAIPAGVVLAINPTITLNAGGQFTYDNLQGDIADFPSFGGTETGTYQFVRESDTAFTIAFSFTDPTDDFTLRFTGFDGSLSAITSMTCSFVAGGTATDITVDLSGTPLAPGNAGTGGGTGNNNNGNASNPPTSVLSQVYEMQLDFLNDSAPGNFPYALNDPETFTLSGSGKLFIGAGSPQTDAGNPIAQNGSEYLYEDTASGLFFGVSVVNDALNEINVYGDSAGTMFYGQFVLAGGDSNNDDDDNNNNNTGSAVAGTYSITFEVTVLSAGSVDSRVGLSTGSGQGSSVNTTATVVDSGGDGTPDSIQFAGGNSIPYSSDGGSVWIFMQTYGSAAHNVTVQAFKNLQTGEISGIAVSYINTVAPPVPPVITNYTWTSGDNISKQ